MEWFDKPKIIIPLKILNVCQAIQNKIGAYEFSILVKPAEIKPYTIILSENYTIPKQKVSSASVDYDTNDMLELIKKGFNVVIHSHHNMDIGFSSTDKQMLHQGDILASILFRKNTFVEAVVLVKSTLFGVAEIAANIEIQYPEIDVSNIEIYKPKTFTPKRSKKKEKYLYVNNDDYLFDHYYDDFFIY